MLAESTENVVGGTVPGAGNLISGNVEGVTVDAAFGNRVQGNLIGTDAGGTLAIPNGTAILLLGHENTIGGIEPAARNVISGSIDNGITLDLGAANNEIMGNLIGTDVTGTVALGNGGRGIFINDAYDNTVGGGARGAPNVISGNRSGISLSGGASGNAIRGNLIGTDVSGTEPLGNARAGILLSTEASGNPIGGRRAGSGNVVAFNGAAGIRLVSSAGAGNALEGNAIFENVGLGIDLGDAGVTENDLRDEDEGPNDLQNFPVLETVGPSAIVGFLHSSPDAEFRLQFFGNETCDPSSHGEGMIVLGVLSVLTDGNGDAAFTFTVPVPSGSFVTATATGPARSTSEFSACVPSR
jgi:titin